MFEFAFKLVLFMLTENRKRKLCKKRSKSLRNFASSTVSSHLRYLGWDSCGGRVGGEERSKIVKDFFLHIVWRQSKGIFRSLGHKQIHFFTVKLHKSTGKWWRKKICVCLNYLWSIASIRIFAAGECTARVNSRVFGGRVLASLSFTLPSRELVGVLTVKAHRFLSPLGESSIITCCLFIDIWIDSIT